MEDVVWYGDSVKSENQLTGVMVNLMNNQTFPNEVVCPFHYLFSVDDAKCFKSETMPSWPIVFKVAYTSGKIYYPTTIIKNVTEFISKVKDVEGEDPEAIIMVSLPNKNDLSESTVGKNSIFYYLGSDFAFVHNVVTKDNFMLSTNNKKLFKTHKLNDKLVYRFTYSNNTWWIENVIEKDDERIVNLKKHTLASLVKDDAAIKDFYNGYKNGFNDQEKYHSFLFTQNLTAKAPVGDSFNLGYFIGFNVNLELSNLLRNSGLDLNSIVSDPMNFMIFKATTSSAKVEKLKKLSGLHNTLVSGETKLSARMIQSILENLTKSETDDLVSLLSIMVNAGTRLACKGALRPNQHDNFKDLILGLDNETSCSLTTELSFDLAQFRIVHKNKNHVNIRLQATNLKSHIIFTAEGLPPKVLNKYFNPDLETDFMVGGSLPSEIGSYSKYLKSLDSIKFEEKSKANTQMKYSKLVIDGDVLRSEEGIFVCFKADLFSALKQSGVLNLAEKIKFNKFVHMEKTISV